MRPLFTITEDLIALNDYLDSVDGDLSKCDFDMEEAVVRWLDALGLEEGRKLDAYLGLIKQLEMESVASKAEKEQWAAKEKGRASRAEWLKLRLKRHLEMTGRASAETATGRKIAIQRNGGKPPLHIGADVTADQLPERFVKIEKRIDTEAVRAALEGGEQLLFASIGDPGTHLRIR